MGCTLGPVDEKGEVARGNGVHVAFMPDGKGLVSGGM
jgi:hypothetical protein